MPLICPEYVPADWIDAGPDTAPSTIFKYASVVAKVPPELAVNTCVVYVCVLSQTHKPSVVADWLMLNGPLTVFDWVVVLTQFPAMVVDRPLAAVYPLPATTTDSDEGIPPEAVMCTKPETFDPCTTFTVFPVTHPVPPDGVAVAIPPPLTVIVTVIPEQALPFHTNKPVSVA